MTALHRRTRAFPAVLLSMAALVAACTIPTDDVARPIEDGPEDLLDITTTTVEVVPAEEIEFVLNLYFVCICF